MIEGNLYEIKPQTVLDLGDIIHAEGAPSFPIIRGWRQWSTCEVRPPFIYLGYKLENWTYNYYNTNKIHYILWKEDIYVMDNQFAKHIIPVWEEEE